MITPMIPVWPERNDEAMVFLLYCNFSAVFKTLFFVFSLMAGWLFNARETVADVVFSFRAISAMVTVRLKFMQSFA